MTPTDAPAKGDLADRLREYRPTNEWGDPVHHLICDEGADRIESLEIALARIAGLNDLSGVPDEHIESDARNRLYECEVVAREALLHPTGGNHGE